MLREHIQKRNESNKSSPGNPRLEKYISHNNNYYPPTISADYDKS